MIIDFLQTDIPKDKLKVALEVLRQFKQCESKDEWLDIPFICWTKLEQLEEFLDYLVNDAPLKAGTIEQL